MPTGDKELEVKFYILDLHAIESRLRTLGALEAQARTHEVNLRFDTPARELSNAYRVLRLRQDTAARLTYKGPGEEHEGARLRQEIEFIVEDFASAQALFEALGYQVVVMYEKYRATYALDPVLVTLDEMPFGSFVEIEGPDGESIRAASQRLGLDWEARILDSYMVLFERARSNLDLSFRDLSFANFTGLEVTPDSLGISVAGG